jgi:hypothetical protein
VGIELSEIPYTPLAGKIEEYFKKFQEAGVPDRVNRPWLESLGFKGGNHQYIIKVLKVIDFIDDSGAPTDLWRGYKDTIKAGAVLAQGIRKGYASLFATYEDANRKDREALYAFFSSKTGKAKPTVDLMVNTFTNLCQLAEWEKEAPVSAQKQTPSAAELAKAVVKPEKGVVSELHINIQLHLPATNDSTVYDALFKSLRKNLLSGEE